MLIPTRILIGATLFAFLPGLACAQEATTLPALREALTFYAPFDEKLDASFALGDVTLYASPSWDQWAHASQSLPDSTRARWAKTNGRFGEALWIDNYEEAALFFKGDKNLAYRATDWSGTVSFWLQTAPDEDFKPGEWSDPVQITPRAWDDAALFVDFTREDVPRVFRFAAFADTKVWNPGGRNWWELPDSAMSMIRVVNPPFGRDRWTHVVMTFDRFNTGRPDGVVKAYLDGTFVGALEGLEQTFTWTSEEETLVRMGLQYVGSIDDLAFFNRALTDDEVKTLHALENGVANLRP